MTDERSPIRIHVLHCGSMLVSKAVPYGGGVNLKNARRGVFDKPDERIELPVSAYLIEHPKGKVLIDTGWSREISPDGVYDAAAVKLQLPGYLAAFYHPWVGKGKTAAEQLAAMGIAPEELSAVVLTHLDADHTSGLRSVKNAQRILLPEEEGWWTIRTVYKLRQPESMYRGVPIEHFWFADGNLGVLDCQRVKRSVQCAGVEVNCKCKEDDQGNAYDDPFGPLLFFLVGFLFRIDVLCIGAFAASGLPVFSFG